LMRMVRCSAPYDGDAVALREHRVAREAGRGVGVNPDLRVVR
jgi:hypothetical protein